MSWNTCKLEDRYKSNSYVPLLRQFVMAMLGQLTVSDAKGFLKRAGGVVWAIESSETGSRRSKRKHSRSVYELCVAPDGVLTSSITSATRHVEHPYTQRVTRDLLIQGYLDAHAAMRAGRLTSAQCAEALMTIVDVRSDTVLMPGVYQNSHFSPARSPGDGFQARYANCTVTYRIGGFVNFQQEDARVNGEVQRAMQYLHAGTGSLSWPWQGTPAPKSVAVLSKPMVTIAQPKTSNAATTLQRITWDDFERALTSLGWHIDHPTSSNKRDRGWHGVFKSVPHKAALPYGDFFIRGTRFLLAQMKREDFEREVNTLVQQRRSGVY